MILFLCGLGLGIGCVGLVLNLCGYGTAAVWCLIVSGALAVAVYMIDWKEKRWI